MLGDAVIKVQFSISVGLIDHTGSIEKIALPEEISENLLRISASDFGKMTKEERSKELQSLIWKYYKVYIQISSNLEHETNFQCVAVTPMEFVQAVEHYRYKWD
eukprot:TRINITY_DN1056_c0_g1_i10.p1 TRINITY_DN1056_c0_g1~~TRINITY_DN1056_c0_g1_i10.p1  ORF type:complete len:104 (-),score=21.54 TRINITY_DN1056_c0_g1_i10:127-438(-)